MAQDEIESGTRGGTGGGTSGTGAPEPTPEGEAAQRSRGGDDSPDAAIGGGRPAGTGGSPGRSGRATGEGTAAPPNPPGGGDPGGMGGVGSGARGHDHRPPGGVSPMSGDEED